MTSTSSDYRRTLRIDLGSHNAAFLWGPRQVGKTTLLHQQFPNAMYWDLLDSDLRHRFLLRPASLREEVLAQTPKVAIVDEIQKVPELLDEVHWCLENTTTKFILCGSSARKLKRGAANLLGGRAWRFDLFPVTTHEIEDRNLERVLNHGMLPKHYRQNKPDRSLRSYVADYISQEIQAEALTRSVPAFARFLEAAALTHGQLLNYANVARECGVSPKTVREYYQILEDTLLGHTLEPWRKSRDRRLIETSKFYFFDVGVARALCGLRRIVPRTDEFGRAFEHFLIEEVRAYLSYTEQSRPLSYWRTSTGLEVDLIVGTLDLAIEFKATDGVNQHHTQGLRALMKDQRVKRALVVSLDPRRRQLEDRITVYPWAEFCDDLWKGKLLE